MHRARLLFGAVTLVVGLLGASTVSVSAEEPTKAERHCAQMIEPSVGDRPSTVRASRCFGSFAEAASFGSGGKITLAPHARPGDVTKDIVSAAGLLGAWLLSIDYTDTYLQGSTTSTYGNDPCGSGITYGSPNLAWNDISSAQGWACNLERYYSTNYFGSKDVCTSTCNTLTFSDNHVWSARWY